MSPLQWLCLALTATTALMALRLAFISRLLRERAREIRLLRDTARRALNIVDKAADAIVSFDDHGVIEWCNAAAERVFGHSAVELAGRPISAIMPSHFRLRNNRLRVVGLGSELQGRRRDGSTFPGEMSFSEYQQGERWQFTAFVRDISERKQAEDALLRAKVAAEEATHAKSAFLANMSHEIRTPMNGVLGMTELALLTELTAEQREYLETAQSSAHGLLTIINDILDFSKIEARRLQLESVPFLLRDELGAALKTLAVRAQHQGLELLCDVPKEVPDALMGDPGRLRQIVTNLVGNALKFTERGEIVVSARLVASADADVRVEFSVSDTGIGVAADKLDTIFQSFSQADGSITRRFGGTGLGLTISSELVALMGGRLWVESVVGQGSTFRFTVLLQRDLSCAPAVDLPAVRGLPVLVVDPNDNGRRILVEMLASWQLKPVAAGAQVLTELKRARFRLLVIDAKQAEAESLIAQIRADAQLAQTRIIVLGAAVAPLGSDDGRTARLPKPVIASRLLETIQALLARDGRAVIPLLPQPVRARRKLHFLLAEDNAVNRRVATRLLEKAGHSVESVENGRLAVQAWSRGRHDAIFMDVQMPEMDGLEATRAIRETEKTTAERIPIIALTAQAMKGDRELCLAAGMDGYVAKPIEAAQLFAAIEQLVPTGEALAIDHDELLQQLGGDRSLRDEILQIYRDESGAMRSALCTAVAARDGLAVERAAHKLKGALLNLAALPSSELALELERMGRARELQGADALLERLQVELNRLDAELAPALQAQRAIC